VLDEAGAVWAEAIDEASIDEEVARFRSALEAVDPGQLQLDDGGESADADDTDPGSSPEEPPDSPDT
jgi:hypothetical protein